MVQIKFWDHFALVIGAQLLINTNFRNGCLCVYRPQSTLIPIYDHSNGPNQILRLLLLTIPLLLLKFGLKIWFGTTKTEQNDRSGFLAVLDPKMAKRGNFWISADWQLIYMLETTKIWCDRCGELFEFGERWLRPKWWKWPKWQK